MSIKFQKKVNDIKEFWKKYEQKIVLAIGIILIAVISFEVGASKGLEWKQKPLIITRPGNTLIEEINKTDDNNSLVPSKTTTTAVDNKNILEKKCAFVASKNSKKYHKNNCRWSKRILSKNRICFRDIKEAEQKGFTPANCLK